MPCESLDEFCTWRMYLNLDSNNENSHCVLGVLLSYFSIHIAIKLALKKDTKCDAPDSTPRMCDCVFNNRCIGQSPVVVELVAPG